MRFEPSSVNTSLKFGSKGKVTVAGTADGAKVSAKAQVLPMAWVGATGAGASRPRLLAEVCVYAPKAGFCEVYEVLLTVGADGKFDKAEQAVDEKTDWGGQNICGAVHFRLPLIVPGQDAEILSPAAIRQAVNEMR